MHQLLSLHLSREGGHKEAAFSVILKFLVNRTVCYKMVKVAKADYSLYTSHG